MCSFLELYSKFFGEGLHLTNNDTISIEVCQQVVAKDRGGIMYSFEEIMKFHNDNINVYNEIKRNLSVLVPFVGAGLSQFAYYSWSALLNELTKNITNRNDFRKIKGLIKQGGKHYLEVAQYLEDLRMPSNLARDIANLFSPKKLKDKEDQLTKEPIWLLPLLFAGFAITTNFDQTLETVYENNYHLCKIFEHDQLSLLNQYLNQVNDYPGIFKIHGTVSGDYIEYDHIVFTENQYKKFYGDGYTLTEALKKCLEQKTILFLGCSLSQDCTMDILESVLEEGKNYYTIINCKKSERDQKIRELGDKHIRAIVYEGRRHEAVRVILEHLLEETNPDAYKALDYHVGALKSLGANNRFTYDAGIVPFVGREIEMNELNTFLDNPETAFKWWAITGPGGCGKSRLAYEFKNQLSNDWETKYLNSEDYENLSVLAHKMTEKTLLIADYVQEHAKELGQFMAKLNNNPRNLPLRVLLVERETSDESKVASWVTQLYSSIHNEVGLKKACYKDFLNIQPLSDDNLKIIIKNYAMAMKPEYNKGYTMSDKIADMLLQKLKTIDPYLYRPLYAMFLTDAYIEGNDPERWNREEILDYIIGRENKRLNFNVAYIMGSEDSKLFSACKYLLCVSTVIQDISLDNLKELCPEKWDIVEKKSERFESSRELLSKIGLTVKNEIPALRPDLVGEYFVLDWLIKQREEVSREFLKTVWRRPFPTSVFFHRIFNDYNQILNEKRQYWDTIYPSIFELSKEGILLYSSLLVDLIPYCNMIDLCERNIDILEQLLSNYPNDIETVVTLARGLFNLSLKHEEKLTKQDANKLEKLFLDYPNIIDIKVCLAKILVSLSCAQEKSQAKEAISRLEQLSLKYPDVPEIIISLALGLFNYSVKHKGKQGIREINQIERLSLDYSNIGEVTIIYAISLSYQVDVQSEKKSLRTVSKLEMLHLEYPNIPEIAIAYANGLINLGFKHNAQLPGHIILKLENLSLKYSNLKEMLIPSTNDWENLSDMQQDWLYAKLIERLKKY